MFRAVAARGNYLGQGRVGMQFAAKEISRFTSKPEDQDWRSATRLVRRLKDNKRVAIEYKFQRLPEKVVVWSDTNFAGCRRTRRSTSGGVVMFGNHRVKTHSQTQQARAVSSGESEFFSVVKAAAMGLGMKGLMEDLGVAVGAQANTDSSAAKSITARGGAGRARCTEVQELWVQDRITKGELTVAKVKGESNVADDLTKCMKRHTTDALMKVRRVVRKSGRHEFCPYLGD